MKNSQPIIPSKAKVRKDLNADALIKAIHESFDHIEDSCEAQSDICLSDALMSGFAVFSLKSPSLLAFDRRRTAEPHNIMSVYGVKKIPCDTQMRTRLDEVDPDFLRPAYKVVFNRLQRGKAVEEMVYLDDCYIVSIDGTGYFSSEKLNSPYCMVKKSKSGKTTYYLQALGAAIVHPDKKEVIPLPPEPICKQDGQTKNDCERNSCRRWLGNFRQDHPHLKVVVVEDGLSPNGPHIRDLKRHGCHFILSCKEDDHTYLCSHLDVAVEAGESIEYDILDEANPKVHHFFRFTNSVPLNESNQDILVNVLEYWEHKGNEIKYFCWVTDLLITKSNVYRIMRAGRARWKIENETFNTLKNQGYNFEHNYGLGKKYLSMTFLMLMMLAFLVDQALQLTCHLFNSVWKKSGCKRELWENVRSVFRFFSVDSMQMIYEIILAGQQKFCPVENAT